VDDGEVLSVHVAFSQGVSRPLVFSTHVNTALESRLEKQHLFFASNLAFHPCWRRNSRRHSNDL